MFAFYVNKTHGHFNTYTLIDHTYKHFPNSKSNYSIFYVQ